MTHDHTLPGRAEHATPRGAAAGDGRSGRPRHRAGARPGRGSAREGRRRLHPGHHLDRLRLRPDLVQAPTDRGVALDTSARYTASAYYTGPVKNDYAAFFHAVGLDKRAYAFPYDDVNTQSSAQILGNANPATGLTLGIGW
ncbi:beta-1,3-glucanase family protein [Streptomyces sp. NPDC060223]|uniref:beta-1,3-glucanase family protein n=1 Tax=unclassified Streptomyces TaxID=2593676 RepID=UPI003630B669